MARRGRRRHEERDVTTIASFAAPRTLTPPRPTLVTDPFDVFPEDAIPFDERVFHPAPAHARPARTRGGVRPRLEVYTPQQRVGLSPLVRHIRPERLVICIRRKIRREVIHALNLRRKGSGGGKKRKRTIRSDVRC